MSLYVVTYQIRPFRDIAPIVEELQRSPSWEHHMDNTWLIQTHETAQQLYSRIAPRFLQTDLFLIVEFSRYATYMGWLPQEAWDWINQHRY